MDEFKSEAELKDFMARIERENYEAYINRLKQLFTLPPLEECTPEEIQQLTAKFTRILADLEKEYKENPKPYEFNLELVNMNEAIQVQREIYMNNAKHVLNTLREWSGGMAFVVTAGRDELYRIVAVFNKRSLASEFIRGKNDYFDNYQIETYPLNPEKKESN